MNPNSSYSAVSGKKSAAVGGSPQSGANAGSSPKAKNAASPRKKQPAATGGAATTDQTVLSGTIFNCLNKPG